MMLTNRIGSFCNLSWMLLFGLWFHNVQASHLGYLDRLHKSFSQTEIQQVFGSKDAGNVPSHSIITTRLEYGGSGGQCQLNIRKWNNADVELPTTLSLVPTKGLVSDSLVRINRGKNSSKLTVGSSEDVHRPNCHFSHRSKRTLAAISTCDDVMKGTIIHDGQLYVIHPVPERHHSMFHKHIQLPKLDFSHQHSSAPHVVYKREAPFSSPNDNNDNGTFCGVDANERTIFRDAPFLSKVRPNPPTSRQGYYGDLTVELGVFIDYEMYRNYVGRFGGGAESKLEDFVLTAFNNIQMLYRQDGLRPKITFKIVHYEIFSSGQPYDLSATRIGNGYAQSYLDAFCSYQSKRWTGTWDHGFLFTGIDLYSSRGDRSISGIARLNGMCSSRNSCTVSEGLDFNAVFIGTHELGHNLGMGHDEPYCGSNYIMSGALGAGKIQWSTCSNRDYKYFVDRLDQYGDNCLRKENGFVKLAMNLNEMPGQRYSADEQCAIMHGTGYTKVSGDQSSNFCSMIWCSKIGWARLITSHPALEGTDCGSGNWCVYGRCVPYSSSYGHPAPYVPQAVNGGWSAWSSTTCTQCRCSEFSDGLGVQASRRTCTNPTPKSGGAKCSGEEMRGIVCATDCSGSTDTLQEYMNRICARQRRNRSDNLSGKGLQRTGSSVRDRSCKVFCEVDTVFKGKQYRFFGDNLPDGTRCGTSSYDKKYCISGKCLSQQCYTAGLVDTSSNCPDNSDLCSNRDSFGTGNWEYWSSWNSCSKTCGRGIRQRSRSCSKNHCPGSNSQSEDCNKRACEGEWATWQAWETCSATCGYGTQMRYRQCDDGYDCSGENRETGDCNIIACSEPGALWSAWSRWSSCSATCGGGNRSRQRACPSGYQCTGVDMEESTCNSQVCAQRDSTYGWNTWAAWSSCSATCGAGKIARYRDCKTSYCAGSDSDIRDCHEGACSSKFTEWSFWSDCSRTCGSGTKSRTRSCDGRNCQGQASETQTCNTNTCDNDKTPVYEKQSDKQKQYAEWGYWGSWSSCGVTCGTGSQMRQRHCADSRKGCFGDGVEHRNCQENPCAEWTEWSQWSSCSGNCEQAKMERSRSCYRGTQCPGEKQQTQPCRATGCSGADTRWRPANTNYDSVWSSWSACSATCGTDGTHRRTRTCYSPGCSNDETVKCHSLAACAEWGGWGLWSDCNIPCGGGSQKRIRNCYGDGGCFGNDSEYKACNLHPCRRSRLADYFEKSWGDWQEWSLCSNGCGFGKRQRTRPCFTESGCKGTNADSEVCTRYDGCRNTALTVGTPSHTTVAANWSSWAHWMECSRTCGGGYRKRSRFCSGGACYGSTSESESCNTKRCRPTEIINHDSFSTSTWSEWGDCSETCGDSGVKLRTRGCQHGYCPFGDLKERQSCNRVSCPRVLEWGSWNTCSQTCGGGTQSRTRNCDDFYGSPRNCGDSEGTQTRYCNSQDCSQYSPSAHLDKMYYNWGPWGYCSATCGTTGNRKRIRQCKPNSNCLIRVLEDTETCYSGECPS